MDIIQKKIMKLCNDLHDDEIKMSLNKLINEYLSCENSSINIVLQWLDVGIETNSSLLTKSLIKDEIKKLTGKKYIDDEKIIEQERKILLDYETIDLGNDFFSEKALIDLSVNLGVIDMSGVYHPCTRKGSDFLMDHRKIATILKERNLIIEHYIRVGTICGINQGVLTAESIYYGNRDSLNKFLLTEKMAMALYNSIMSKKGKGFTTFEEKLAYFGNEFGYFSTRYDLVNQIYNDELFENNMEVLSYTLGKRFDKRFFKQILTSKY